MTMYGALWRRCLRFGLSIGTAMIYLKYKRGFVLCLFKK
jgi:hypothetical protein